MMSEGMHYAGLPNKAWSITNEVNRGKFSVVFML
jgi:hypothetical protein